MSRQRLRLAPMLTAFGADGSAAALASRSCSCKVATCCLTLAWSRTHSVLSPRSERGCDAPVGKGGSLSLSHNEPEGENLKAPSDIKATMQPERSSAVDPVDAHTCVSTGARIALIERLARFTCYRAGIGECVARELIFCIWIDALTQVRTSRIQFFFERV